MSDHKVFAQVVLEILELEGVKHIFGHPGEQILPVYEVLRNSKIKHVLMRREQGAAHAADAYARVSGNFGVCIASAGPGALNLTMGIATAYKDSVPILVITGDVPLFKKGCNVFQEIDTNAVFKPITIQSHNIENTEEGVIKLKEALETFKNGKTGPIHLNIPRDVLEKEMEISSKDEIALFESFKEVDESQKRDKKTKNAIKLIENSKKPIIIAGMGIFWSNAIYKLINFANKYNIPVSTTYPARGVFPDDSPLYMGMIGIRGTEKAIYAGKNADLIIALGTRLSERTMNGLGECQIIQVNMDDKSLKGTINLKQDVGTFLDQMGNLTVSDFRKWIYELEKYPTAYDIKTDFDNIPIKPQRAIKEILDAAKDSIIVNDAGSHTTWVTLLQQIKEPASCIFSGGFGPMGYAIPASVGAALAKSRKSVVAIVGDGGFQMTSQELATIKQLNLRVLICLINNHSLGIIKQWQKINYGNTFEVELQNPDFIKLAESYGIDSKRLYKPGEIYPLVKKALTLKKPYFIEVVVDPDEEIPLPKGLNPK
jgi:acetolactate synthase-1/2/3 large subunit